MKVGEGVGSRRGRQIVLVLYYVVSGVSDVE